MLAEAVPTPSSANTSALLALKDKLKGYDVDKRRRHKRRTCI
jgi:hypothetical protein